MEQRPANASLSSRLGWWWIFDPRYSLRARAALIFGGGTLTFGFLLTWICGVLYERALLANVGNAFENLAFQLSDKLDRTVYDRYRSLVFAANLDPIRNPSASSADRRRVFDSLRESNADFAWIGVTDSAGQIVAATDRLFEGADATVRPWFRDARERPYIGSAREMPDLVRVIPALPDPEGAPRFLDIAVPVTGADGKFAGVIAAHVVWSWARELQTSVVSEAAARDRIGVTLYNGPEVLLDSGALGWTYPPEAPLAADGRRVRGWTLEKTAVGPIFMTGFARSRGVREYRGIGWLAVVRQPLERTLGAVPPLQRSIAAWSVVLALVAGIASWAVAGRHVRRLRTVRGAADRIREADILSVLPHPTDESELSEMCRSLSDLVEDLRQKQQHLAADNARLRRHADEPAGAKPEFRE